VAKKGAAAVKSAKFRAFSGCRQQVRPALALESGITPLLNETRS
jgi:hypothetical protein